MLALAIYFERREDCGRKYRIEQWKNLVRAFGVDHVYVIDRVNIPCFQPDFKSQEIVGGLEQVSPKYKLVFVDNVCPPNRQKFDLREFHHPQGDVCYVIGADALGIADVDHRTDTDYEGVWLEIPVACHYGLWSEHAAAIVLSHRWSHANS